MLFLNTLESDYRNERKIKERDDTGSSPINSILTWLGERKHYILGDKDMTNNMHVLSKFK